MDLPDPPERLQMAGEVRPAHGDADAVAALGQGTDDVAAEETRAAEYGHELIDVGLSKHAISAGWRAVCGVEYRIGARLLRGRAHARI